MSESKHKVCVFYSEYFQLLINLMYEQNIKYYTNSTAATLNIIKEACDICQKDFLQFTKQDELNYADTLKRTNFSYRSCKKKIYCLSSITQFISQNINSINYPKRYIPIITHKTLEHIAGPKTLHGIGSRFEELVIWKDTGKRLNGYIVWICKCRCGGTIEATTKELSDGIINNCGDHTKHPPIRHRSDLSGRRFGLLTVIHLDEKKTFERGPAYWTVECACKTRKSVRGSSLTTEATRSCGSPSCKKLLQEISNKDN